MIQLVVNVELLREIDERKLINAYARFIYNDESDITDDIQIRKNLIQLFDWDKNGSNGLGIYCSHFEEIKKKDWERLINFIKENGYEIELLSRSYVKEKRCSDKNYKVSGRGKKARPCIYEGREYKSRQECMYKEGLTKYQLWVYLKETNQI